MKILIAVLTAHHPSRQHFINLIYETWLSEAMQLFGYENCKFFYGRGPFTAARDCIQLDVDDSYAGLAAKTQGALAYAYHHDYDFCLRLCDDTKFFPYNFGKAFPEFMAYDYVGHFLGDLGLRRRFCGFMHGGTGILFSRIAMGCLLCPIRLEYFPPSDTARTADDQWIGLTLQGLYPYNHASEHELSELRKKFHLNSYQAAYRIKVLHDPRFSQEIATPDAVTLHTMKNSHYLREPK